MSILFLLYVIISTLLILYLSKGQKEVFLFKWIIVIFLPIIGWFFPSIWPKKWIKNNENYFANYLNEQTGDITVELSIEKQKLERQEELNILSIEEALIINDYATRRKVLIDVLKQDAMQYIDALKMAVINEDTETSHYAATAVIEVKRELTLLLQKLAVEFSQKPHDSNVAITYAEVIQEYLRSGFLDSQSQKQYKLIYSQIIDQLIQNNDATEQHFVNKISNDLSLNDVQNAENTIKPFKKAYPLSEQAFFSAMTIYFKKRSLNRLASELNELKASPIVLSSNGLKIVRYWSEVISNDETVT